MDTTYTIHLTESPVRRPFRPGGRTGNPPGGAYSSRPYKNQIKEHEHHA